MGSGLSALINLSLGLAARESFHPVLLLAFPIGLLLDVGGTVCNRWAHQVTRDLGINMAAYAEPVLVVLWAFLLFGLGVRDPGFLLLGVFLVVLSNLLGTFWERSSRSG